MRPAVSFFGEFAQTIFAGEASADATLIGVGLGDARNDIPITYTYQTSVEHAGCSTP